LLAGLNGATTVGVHFHSCYVDGFDLVHALRNAGVNAFPVQADVTNPGELWATRSYVIEQGSMFGCWPRPILWWFGGFPPAARRADQPGRLLPSSQRRAQRQTLKSLRSGEFALWTSWVERP